MATFNIEKVPNAFKSQQPSFFFGGSQVPNTLLLSGLSLHQQQPKKKRKITQYYKKPLEVIDLVSDSDSDNDFPMYFQSGKLMSAKEYKNYKKNKK